MYANKNIKKKKELVFICHLFNESIWSILSMPVPDTDPVP
jgi:hypothetical protein